MNELAIIFDRLGIPTKEVLQAAGTKWNFLPFKPGLVGGHCIGVDPYYLTARAEAAGYYPQVILSGRRINDGMGDFIAQRLVKLLIAAERPVKCAKVGIVGITFKEDVPDLRNSRVPDIVAGLREFGIRALVTDPLADPAEAKARSHRAGCLSMSSRYWFATRFRRMPIIGVSDGHCPLRVSGAFQRLFGRDLRQFSSGRDRT